jgi:hypothetical protein
MAILMSLRKDLNSRRESYQRLMGSARRKRAVVVYL